MDSPSPRERGGLAHAVARRQLIAGHRRALLLEAIAAVVVFGALIESSHYIAAATIDLQGAFGLALFTFSVGLILLFHHANEMLDLECPHCQEMFHGDGVEQASTPFRRRCAHCELPASPRRAATPSAPPGGGAGGS